MDLKALSDMPPWEWPEGAGNVLLDTLRDQGANESDRLIAAELASDVAVINEELVDALLLVLRSGNNSETLRARAAISLGPVLEYADTQDFENPDELPIMEQKFRDIQALLGSLYKNANVSAEVRRRILEASVRAPEQWHQDAIRAAYLTDDEAWKLTAVFGTQFVRGFDEQILHALGSKNPDIHYEAVVAAGNWELAAAWPHIAALITLHETDKDLLLAAIGAAVTINPQEVLDILRELAESDDEDVVNAVHEAMAMAEGILSGDDDEEDEDDDNDELLN